MNLGQFYFSDNAEDIALKKQLFHYLDISKGLDLNLKLGIPCCTCYNQIIRDSEEIIEIDEPIGRIDINILNFSLRCREFRENCTTQDIGTCIDCEYLCGINYLVERRCTDKLKTCDKCNSGCEKYKLLNKRTEANKVIFSLDSSESESIFDIMMIVDESAEKFVKRLTIKNYHVVGLNLSYCKLSIIPEDVKNLTQLEYLNINNNIISVLPDWLYSLTSLQLFLAANTNIPRIPNILIDKITFQASRPPVMGGLDFKESEIENEEHNESLRGELMRELDRLRRIMSGL